MLVEIIAVYCDQDDSYEWLNSQKIKEMKIFSQSQFSVPSDLKPFIVYVLKLGAR